MLTNPPIHYDHSNFTSTYRGVNALLALCLNSVLNVKALVGAFNQEKALVGAFSVIVQLHRLIVSQHYLDTGHGVPLLAARLMSNCYILLHSCLLHPYWSALCHVSRATCRQDTRSNDQCKLWSGMSLTGGA